MREVLMLLGAKIDAQWDDLGLGLNLHPSALDSIRQDGSNDCHLCLKRVVKSWLKGNSGERSWKFLCDAISSETFVGNSVLANEIRKIHCKH